MNHVEEQEMEVEALQSLFFHDNELELVSPTNFVINLLPFPDEEEENHVSASLEFTYPATYPEVLPEVSVRKVAGLSEKKEAVFRDEVMANAMAEAEPSLGMPMVYIIAEVVQNWLRDNNEKELTMHEQAMLQEKEKSGAAGDEEEEEEDEDEELPDEEQEWKGLDVRQDLVEASKRLTPDSFKTWFEAFHAEMVKKGFRKAATAKGVNGRQFFQQNKHLLEASDVGGGAGDDGDDIDEALFGEDVELPDDLDDDDADR